MGLSRTSTGKGASLGDTYTIKQKQDDKVIALLGNPNVGKSTVFNSLTGMKQHTGNWTGKTVTSAVGRCVGEKNDFLFADLPGCYSLSSRSAEEEVARDFLYFGNADRAVVVCDASCLERNFYLAVQVLEAYGSDTVICLNLIDEAKKNGFEIHENILSERLSIPVISMSARHGKEAHKLLPSLDVSNKSNNDFSVNYPEPIENYITDASVILFGKGISRREARVISLRILDSSNEFVDRLSNQYGVTNGDISLISSLAKRMTDNFYGGSTENVIDAISSAISDTASKVTANVVTPVQSDSDTKRKKSSVKKIGRDTKIDRILIGKITAFPVMALLLFAILWITVKGANYPSELLSKFFTWLEKICSTGLTDVGVPNVLRGLICEGVIRVVGWVVAVMLPPMAIFFPLFTILEDIGYLPRIAFNLDRCFKKCDACGKQALTMCMGFGCNAAGVVGCRIIDSPRERLIAVLTNCFMPCNGRFPMLIAMIAMFFAAGSGSLQALILAFIVVFAIGMTLAVSKLLSMTVLKGVPSSFTLELPPYRTPQIGKVLVRSIFDRTLFVLGRAVAVAAPTGIVIWCLSNINVAGQSILLTLASFLDPIGTFFGLDGVIILAFILGLPANEIVVPIILLCYTAGGSLVNYSSLSELKNILISNGWTTVTAINMIIFTVFHWPCSTTILTIKKETSSIKHTVAAVLIPTCIGLILCLSVKLFSLIF